MIGKGGLSLLPNPGFLSLEARIFFHCYNYQTMRYKDILHFARELRKNQTPAEQFFWEKVRNRRFMGKKFTRQFIIEHSDIQGDKSFFIADFHCREKRLVVELDGNIHKEQVEYDRMREEILREMGFVIIRFRNEEVLENWNRVAERLREALE